MRVKKSLGQHFLTSHSIAERIVRASGASRNDTVLEIGPGKGILTRALLAKVKHVIAVEKDKQLFELLTKKFEQDIANGKLLLIHDDILKCDLARYKLQATSHKTKICLLLDI